MTEIVEEYEEYEEYEEEYVVEGEEEEEQEEEITDEVSGCPSIGMSFTFVIILCFALYNLNMI